MQEEKKKHINTMHHRLIAIGIALGALSWFLESAVHVFLFHEGNFIQQMYRPKPHETWMRFIVVAMFIAFGVYSQWIVSARKQADQALRESELRKPWPISRKMQEKQKKHIDTKHDRLIAIGIALGALSWILESAVHVFLFHEGNFIQQMYRPKPHETWMRFIVVAMFIAFGVYSQWIVSARKQADQALRESELWLKSIFNSLEEAVFVLTLEGKVVNVNGAAERMFRYSLEELSKLSTEVLHVDHEHYLEFGRRIKEAFDEGEAASFEFEVRRKNGGKFPSEHTVSLLKNTKGKPIGIVSVVRDISERKQVEGQLREGKAMLQSVFDGISDPLILLDENLSVKMVNKAASEYYQLGQRNIIGKPCFEEFMGRSKPCQGCSIPSTVLNGENLSIERKGIVDPNRLEQIAVYHIREKDGKARSTIIRIADITRARQTERELRQADKMISLGVLVSGVAHEINNPNNFIMLNTPLLLEAWESIVPILEKYYDENGDFSVGGLPYSEMRNDVSELFSGIEEGSKRINRIVQDLKDFSRQETSDMNQFVNVNEVIERAITLVNNLIKKSTNKFSVEYGKNLPLIKGNLQKLEQVMINLIQNACQALPDRGRGIFVTSSYDEKNSGIIVKVRDEGTGIPDEALPRIMDPFFTTKRNYGGTGIGLSVSTNIVKEHGGKIEVETQRDKETTFTVSLPTTRTQEQAKILVADDDDSIRGALTKVLRKEPSYLVHEASNGAEACVKLGHDCPDLLILDLMMPNMDGVEVCRLIKKEPKLSGTDVIVFTGFPNSPKMDEIAEMGFKNILPKPLDVRNFIQMVDTVLKERPIKPIVS